MKFAKFLRTFFYRTTLVAASMLLFMKVPSFTSPCRTSTTSLQSCYFLRFQETLSSLNHCYYMIIIIIAEWSIKIAETTTTYTATSTTVICVSALMVFMLKRKKNNIWINYNWKIFLNESEWNWMNQACNFTILTRMYNLSKFCLKVDKADADILK